MSFNNIDEIKKEFKLTTNDLDDLRKELRKLQTKHHPDKNGGSFKNVNDQSEYLRATSAIEFIDDIKKNDTLIPLKEVTSLIATIKELIPTNNDNAVLRQEIQLSERIDSSTKSFKSSHFIPKITLTTISAILSLLWLFPSRIKEHPVLGKFIDIESNLFTYSWLALLILTGELWLFFAIVENKDKQFKSLLKIEAFQNEVFKEFIGYWGNKCGDRGCSFTKNDFIDFVRYEMSINRDSRKRDLMRFLSNFRRLDVAVAQSLVDIILTRLENKGCISKDNKKALSDVYLLNKDVEL